MAEEWRHFFHEGNFDLEVHLEFPLLALAVGFLVPDSAYRETFPRQTVVNLLTLSDPPVRFSLDGRYEGHLGTHHDEIVDRQQRIYLRERMLFLRGALVSLVSTNVVVCRPSHDENQRLPIAQLDLGVHGSSRPDQDGSVIPNEAQVHPVSLDHFHLAIEGGRHRVSGFCSLDQASYSL